MSDEIQTLTGPAGSRTVDLPVASTTHGEGLTRSCLTVRHDSGVVSVEESINQWRNTPGVYIRLPQAHHVVHPQHMLRLPGWLQLRMHRRRYPAIPEGT